MALGPTWVRWKSHLGIGEKYVAYINRCAKAEGVPVRYHAAVFH